MLNHSTDPWSLRVGQPGGVELRVHIAWPLLALGVALVAAKTHFAGSTEVVLALLVLLVSVTAHELVRAVTAFRVGGHPSSLVLGPIGGLTKLHLPVDPPAHLITALAGTMTYLVLLVAGACVLALSEERHQMAQLLQPCAPPLLGSSLVAGGEVAGELIESAPWLLAAKWMVWTNWCLLLVSLLPVDPCNGAQLLRGVLWPMVGRATASSVTSRVALVLSGLLAALAVLLSTQDQSVPAWFPLSVIAVFLCYGGVRESSTRRYDVGLAIDELDSDDEEWLFREWVEEDRQAVLVEHLHDQQQETLDRKRLAHEVNEDERVDAILVRLQETSFDQLSEEDRATLKRASRRYRARLEDPREAE